MAQQQPAMCHEGTRSCMMHKLPHPQSCYVRSLSTQQDACWKSFNHASCRAAACSGAVDHNMTFPLSACLLGLKDLDLTTAFVITWITIALPDHSLVAVSLHQICSPACVKMWPDLHYSQHWTLLSCSVRSERVLSLTGNIHSSEHVYWQKSWMPKFP